jgi:gentisate 1,2-dioxygenase
MTSAVTNPKRARLSSEIAQLNMKPLWERVMRLKPGTEAMPVIWRWAQVQPYLMRAAERLPRRKPSAAS